MDHQLDTAHYALTGYDDLLLIVAETWALSNRRTTREERR